MTRKETAGILGMVKVAYPRTYSEMGSADLSNTVDLWAAMFIDEDFETVKTALYKHVATSKFPPTIAELRTAFSEVTQRSLPTAGEAWSEVLSAIHNYGYCRAEEALNSMSEITQRAVKSMGWSNLCASEEQMPDRAHFIKIYESLEKRDVQQRKIPKTLQNEINLSIEAHCAIAQLPEKFDDTVIMPESIRDTLIRLADVSQKGQGA